MEKDQELEMARWILEQREKNRDITDIAKQIGIAPAVAKRLYAKALKEQILDDKLTASEQYQRLEHLYSVAMREVQRDHILVQSGAPVSAPVLDENGNIVKDENGEPVITFMIDHGGKLSAVDRCVDILKRQAALRGLDKPNKVALTDPKGEKEGKINVVLSATDVAL